MDGLFGWLSVEPRIDADDPQESFGQFRFTKTAQGKSAGGVETYALTCPIKFSVKMFIIHSAYLGAFLQKKTPAFWVR